MFTISADCTDPRGNLHLNAGPVLNGGVEYTLLEVNGQVVTEGTSNKPADHFWDYDIEGPNLVSITFTFSPGWPRPDALPNPLPNLPEGTWTEFPTEGDTVTYSFVPANPGCDTPTATVVPTSTVAPTATTEPTATVSPTMEPTGTVTPSPTATEPTTTPTPTPTAPVGTVVPTATLAPNPVDKLPETGAGQDANGTSLLIVASMTALAVIALGVHRNKKA